MTLPSEALVSSDKRPYRNLTFYNVLARQGSPYCNRARLNFQAFALRDMTTAARESRRGVKRRVIALVFTSYTVLALQEALFQCVGSLEQ